MVRIARRRPENRSISIGLAHTRKRSVPILFHALLRAHDKEAALPIPPLDPEQSLQIPIFLEPDQKHWQSKRSQEAIKEHYSDLDDSQGNYNAQYESGTEAQFEGGNLGYNKWGQLSLQRHPKS